jgi:hypothetical protein
LAGLLPNVFLKEPFFSKKVEEPKPFLKKATNCGFSKMALAPPKKPLRRSHAKHPLSLTIAGFFSLSYLSFLRGYILQRALSTIC